LARLRLYVRVFFDDPCIKINFSGEDEGLLKRNDNELLKAFESLSRLYLFSKISLPKNVRFQVRSTSGNKKEKDLIDLAEKMKKKVLSSKESILLRPMNPSERRIIHQQLSSDKRVKTSSQGDGSMKRVEISLS
jgi:spoIIIJ-associated protein